MKHQRNPKISVTASSLKAGLLIPENSNKWIHSTINLNQEFQRIEYDGLEYYQISKRLLHFVNASHFTAEPSDATEYDLIYVRDNMKQQLQAQNHFLTADIEHFLLYVNGAYGVGKSYQTYVGILQYLQSHEPYGSKQVMWIRSMLGSSTQFEVTIFGLSYDPSAAASEITTLNEDNVVTDTETTRLSVTSIQSIYEDELRQFLQTLEQWERRIDVIVLDQIVNDELMQLGHQRVYQTSAHYSFYYQNRENGPTQISDEMKVILIHSTDNAQHLFKFSTTSFEVAGWTLQDYQHACHYEPCYQQYQDNLTPPYLTAALNIPGILTPITTTTTTATTISAEEENKRLIKEHVIKAKYHLVGACARHMFRISFIIHSNDSNRQSFHFNFHESLFYKLQCSSSLCIDMIENMLTTKRNSDHEEIVLYHQLLIQPIITNVTVDSAKKWVSHSPMCGHFFVSGYVARRLATILPYKYQLVTTMIQHATAICQRVVHHVKTISNVSKNRTSKPHTHCMVLSGEEMNQTVFQMEFLWRMGRDIHDIDSSLVLHFQTNEETLTLSTIPLSLKTSAVPQWLEWNKPLVCNSYGTLWWIPVVYYEDGFDVVQRSLPPLQPNQHEPDCCDLRFFFLAANPFGLLLDTNTPSASTPCNQRVLNLAYAQEFCKRYIECANEEVPVRKCEIYLVVPFNLLDEVKERQPWQLQGTLTGFNVETDFYVVGKKREALDLSRINKWY